VRDRSRGSRSGLVFALLLLCASRAFAAGGLEDGVLPLEGPLKFKVVETWIRGTSGYELVIGLQVWTETIYGSTGFAIVGDTHIGSDHIDVRLHHISVPTAGLVWDASASYGHGLPVPAGRYRLSFTCPQGNDAYELVVTDSLIRVLGAPGRWAVPSTRLFWRVPVASFVCRCDTKAELAWICEGFADSLRTLRSLREFAFPDSGQNPYPEFNSKTLPGVISHFFRYQNESDFDSAGTMLACYTKDVIAHNQGVSIQLANWKMRVFRSWP
jgi:hypothetical protein